MEAFHQSYIILQDLTLSRGMKCDCLTLASAEIVNRHSFSAGASQKVQGSFHESDFLNPPKMGMPGLQEFFRTSDIREIHNCGLLTACAPAVARFFTGSYIPISHSVGRNGCVD